ncbi:hypothetical protein IKD57_04310 [Candidatus Saccharibacteria bacterium]|nr:hypothetical protein [Candidatus Saccharibacteria bacterium]
MLTRSLISTKLRAKALSILLLLFLFSIAIVSPVKADNDVVFNVNVRDSLAMQITTPATWASGNIGEFMRNKINVQVTSNDGGFTASMTTQGATPNLINTSKSAYTIPTLTGDSQVSAFPSNRWGYSLTDTSAGSTSAVYSAIAGAGASTPSPIMTSSSSATQSQDVYFGTKADVSQASGTYAGVVVITVVSGVVDNNSSEPEASPASVDPIASNVVVPMSTSGSSTDDTSNTAGSSQGTYAAPQGVIEEVETISSVNGGNSVATGLAISSAVAAGTGAIFFVAAKRRKDDDEDEEEEA